MVAAGSGERFTDASCATTPRTPAATSTYKQFCQLGGVPLVCRATQAATEAVDVVVVVLPRVLMASVSGEGLPDEIWPGEGSPLDGSGEIVAALRELGAKVVAGGTSRAASVREGLRALDSTVSRVVVHDAVRPAAPAALFVRTLAQLDHADGAVPGLRPTDTVKVVAAPEHAGEPAAPVVRQTLDRNQLMAIQTPQAFRRDVLERAYESLASGEPLADGKPPADVGAEPTDCAGLVEHIGAKVVVVDGDPLAHKVTTPADLMILKALLATQASSANR